MRTMIAAGAFALLAGCAGVPGGFGNWGGPSFAGLQRTCGEVRDYGGDAQSVYSAMFDAWVAKRHGKLTDARFCAFESELAQRHAALGTSADPAERGRWLSYLNDARAQAISWRAAVDPSLRGG
ncbi:hypothetical protein [Burkholderia oklahomensis]|uniref:Lipoprotein n=1 Tax=Burkholderia oklahomensis TaxID=342113 RepID=A0AAI8B4M5_9BURK|nr:hypothetical protein [Burkholderia oklahomensis]AIO65414.1 hypothetical protein DM82_119 [Burkholderia oklahomensis]AOI43466.1 hypothetical protein WG70_28730 [Burkholderia oklahomensis EO147]KUY54020.1 hypothetical protein WG70_12875 [Burkholderia oklahomensis EO147]MDN7673256.1 hypothetical protein [Burkholderia oklahomensis]QPS38216.1 hypothetical protein I6G57_05145 [Burkholderia oklahomensis]